MNTYTLNLRNNATGESIVSFTVSEQMYKYSDLGRVLNGAVARIELERVQNESRTPITTPSAGFSEACMSSGEELKS
jgi:hypothetical protein